MSQTDVTSRYCGATSPIGLIFASSNHVKDVAARLAAALRARGRLVVQAPTGSGKSTQLPQMLLAHGFAEEGEIVVLQPRRLAARLLARRVAEEVGTALGDVVGYQIRLDSRVSARTRIRFVTEGILLRQMSFDPELRGVAAVVFDEFHERHLHGDITLARAKQIQAAGRPDLKIVVMSATLDAGLLREYLAPCAVLESQGRTFPVAVEYLARRADFEREAVWEVAARECARVAGETAGDLLVFMPGGYEIMRTVQALGQARELRGCLVLPLHGELSAEQQDRAVARYEQRKIIVSTNVAETSLTIDGVTVVVDSGLARMARFDAGRGINTLLIEKIAIASADQRAGRAGRTAPGRCVRLWTEREHAERAAQELPEVRRLDLADVVLTLKASGIVDVVGFPWLERPDAQGLARAETLLADLGALEGRRRTITEMGRRMLQFPLHPRYARMLLEAGERGCVETVAVMAALTQGRSFLLRGGSREMEAAREAAWGEVEGSDFFGLLGAWRYARAQRFDVEACRLVGVHAVGARQVGPLAEQFLAIAKQQGLTTRGGNGGDEQVDEVAVRKCVLAGFSDQLAKRLDRGTLRCELVHGRRGLLARESVVQDAALLVAAEISEIEGRGGEVNVLLTQATAIEEAWLKELFPADVVDEVGVVYDAEMRRVIARRERRFRDLVLETKPTAEAPPTGAAAALLAAEVLAERVKLVAWDEAVEQWIVRVNRLAEWFPELEVTPITAEDRATLIEQICYGSYGARELKDKPAMPVLREWLTAEQLAVLDDYLPEKLVMANGRKARLRYEAEGPPVLNARIQELYGIEKTFAVGHGRVPVKFEILAPNHRPIQVTDDLERFWREIYPKVRAELSRRYPRHEWR
jgi:ATP-dependent helicase HrpB